MALKITMFCWGFPPGQLGGAETHSLRLALAWLADSRVASLRVVVGCQAELGGEARIEETEEHGLSITRLWFPTGNVGRYESSATVQALLARSGATRDCDLAYFGLSWYLFDAVESVVRAGIPFVYYAHGYDLACLQANLHRSTGAKCQLPQPETVCVECYSGLRLTGFDRIIAECSSRLSLSSLLPGSRWRHFRCCRREYLLMTERSELVSENAVGVFVPSRYAYRQLVGAMESFGFSTGRVYQVPNGIDTRMFSRARVSRNAPCNRGPVRFVYVGRLDPLKGLHTAISAIGMLSREIPAEYVVYGPLGSSGHESYVGRLKRMCEADPRVRLMGPASPDEVPGLLAGADALLLPTLSDTLSTQIQESLAVGTPVICTNIDGNPEMVEHRRNGLLFPPEDVEALRACLQEFVDDAGMRSSLAAEAKPLWDARQCADEILRVVCLNR
jgi:glycosyltransferase involved in cell wall biosynthesis